MRTGGTILLALTAVGVLAPWITSVDPSSIAAEALRPPSAQHLFGTDDLGHDMFSAVVHGARTSLVVGFVAATLSLVVALLVGGVAAMRGGSVDHLLMRGTEFVQALPRFFLILLIVSFFGSDYRAIILVIGLTAWPSTARVFRAQALAVLGREFVMASRASGGSDATVLVRHVLPLAAPIVAAEAAYMVGGAILAEAGLSFLGLGAQSPTISWGTMLADGQTFLTSAPWVAFFPGAALLLAVLGINLLGDALRDLLDPRFKP
jgi:peptide/nickel transport system permease protein